MGNRLIVNETIKITSDNLYFLDDNEQWISITDLFNTNIECCPYIMTTLTDKDILSLEAVLYASVKNKRTTTCGTFVKNIHSDNPQSISFDDAMINVRNIIDRFYKEIEK